MSGKTEQKKVFPYLIFVSFIILLSIAAYSGYVFYPRFDLPAATGSGLLVLAAGAGVASFFAPCSFPLLVTLLSREVGVEDEEKKKKTRPKTSSFALALSAGATSFLILAGVILAFGGQQLFSGFTFTSPQAMTTRVIVGIVLILLGLVQSGILSRKGFDWIGDYAKPLIRTQAKLRKEHPIRAFFIYGFGYLIAGFG